MADEKRQANIDTKILEGYSHVAKILKEYKQSLDSKTQPGSESAPGDSPQKTAPQERAQFKSGVIIEGYRKPGSVSTTGPFKFFDEAFKKLLKPEDDEEAMPKKQPGWWTKLFGPAVVLLGGLAALVFGLMSEGPIKGILTLIGKVGVMGALMVAARIIGVAIKPILKFIPIVGSLIDFADAFFRFKQGDIGGGVISLVAGLLNFVPVVGPFLSIGLGILNAILDAKGEEGKKFKSQSVGLFVILGRLLATFVPALSKIPYLGAIILLGSAYMRFKQNDVIGGLIDLLAGITGLLGPVGIAVSWGLSILNAFIDSKGEEGKKFKKENIGIFALGGMILSLLAPYMKFVKFIPFLGSMIMLGSSYMRLKQGDITGGLIDMIAGIAGLFPGIGQGIMWGLSILNAIMDSGGSDEKGKKVPKSAGIFTMIASLLSPLISILTKVPFIGSILNFGFAYMRFKRGDLLGGFIDLFAGIANFFPGIGTVIAIGLGMLNYFLDQKSDEEKAEIQSGVGDALKKAGKAIVSFIYTWSGLRTIVEFVGGIKKIIGGDVSGGLLQMAYGLPLVGTIIGWFGGPETAKEAKESLGDKTSFWSRIKQFILGVSPISWIVGIYKGIKYALKGQWKLAATSLVYGIPFLSTVISWLGGPATAEEAVEDMGDKRGFFAKISQYIKESFPIRNILQFWGGIKKILGGELVAGLYDMAYAVPFFGTIASWFGGPETAQDATAEVMKPNSLWSKMKGAILKKLRSWWDKAPRWMKWTAKKVLPDHIVAALEDQKEDDPEQVLATEYDQASTAISDVGGSLQKASKNISSAAGKIAKESQDFGKSSPGAWSILAAASKHLSSNVKKTIKSSEEYIQSLSDSSDQITKKTTGSMLANITDQFAQTANNIVHRLTTIFDEPSKILNRARKLLPALTTQFVTLVTGVIHKVNSAIQSINKIFGIQSDTDKSPQHALLGDQLSQLQQISDIAKKILNKISSTKETTPVEQRLIVPDDIKKQIQTLLAQRRDSSLDGAMRNFESRISTKLDSIQEISPPDTQLKFLRKITDRDIDVNNILRDIRGWMTCDRQHIIKQQRISSVDDSTISKITESIGADLQKALSDNRLAGTVAGDKLSEVLKNTLDDQSTEISTKLRRQEARRKSSEDGFFGWVKSALKFTNPASSLIDRVTDILDDKTEKNNAMSRVRVDQNTDTIKGIDAMITAQRDTITELQSGKITMLLSTINKTLLDRLQGNGGIVPISVGNNSSPNTGVTDSGGRLDRINQRSY